MIQITFEPAYDAYHTIYRHLRLRQLIVDEKGLLEDHFRILDFYLAFPFRMENIKLQRHHARFKALARRLAAEPRYVDHPSDRMVFERMKPIQKAALQTIAAKQLFDLSALEEGFVRATEVPLPIDVAARVTQANLADAGLLEFLGVLATEYPLLGPGGLKDRSGLMDYRYDAV